MKQKVTFTESDTEVIRVKYEDLSLDTSCKKE